MRLNCKVIKKSDNAPISISTPPPFSGLSHLSSKHFEPHQVAQFLEGATPFNKGGGGFQLCKNYRKLGSHISERMKKILLTLPFPLHPFSTPLRFSDVFRR